MKTPQSLRDSSPFMGAFPILKAVPERKGGKRSLTEGFKPTVNFYLDYKNHGVKVFPLVGKMSHK